jgi:hypothetical protein
MWQKEGIFNPNRVSNPVRVDFTFYLFCYLFNRKGKKGKEGRNV